MIETPGKVLKIDIGSRPRTATRSIILLSMVAACADVVVATLALSACTSTVSDTLPTCSCMLPSARRADAARIFPFCSSGRNPLASTYTVYAPGASAPKKKSPVSLVVVLRCSPFNSKVNLTAAPGTT